MKKLFWFLFICLFAAVVFYTAAPESLVKLNINSELVLVISFFSFVGIGLGFLGGKIRYKGMPRKKLPDKGEFLLRCFHELPEYVLLSILEEESGKCLICEIGKKQLLDKDGREFSDFTKLPRRFIVMRRDVADGDGPVRTVYYLISM